MPAWILHLPLHKGRNRNRSGGNKRNFRKKKKEKKEFVHHEEFLIELLFFFSFRVFFKLRTSKRYSLPLVCQWLQSKFRYFHSKIKDFLLYNEVRLYFSSFLFFNWTIRWCVYLWRNHCSLDLWFNYILCLSSHSKAVKLIKIYCCEIENAKKNV